MTSRLDGFDDAHRRLSGHHAGEPESCFGEERFSEEHWTTLESGAPVLREAVMTLDCRLSQCIDMGTHALVIGDVVAGSVVATQPPLLYVDGQWAGIDTRLACAA